MPQTPLVIVRTVADRQLVIALSDDARTFGIRCGMTLTQARALCAMVAHAEHEPEKDQKALEALARWMTRFSPTVALFCGTGCQPVSSPDGKTHGLVARATAEEIEFGIFLDVTGSECVFNGLHNLAEQARAALSRFGVAARLAVAPTPGGAWALTFSKVRDGREGLPVIADERELAPALAPLPTASLRISDDLAAALHHLGLSTIGQVMDLPRGVLPARFGPELLLRLDQALGRVAEPLVPLEYRPPVEARMDFEGVVESLETIWLVFRKLLDRVVPQLQRHGCGARRLEVEFFRPGPGMLPIHKTIHLSRPSRDPVNLFNLFRCATDSPGAEVQNRRRRNRNLIEGFTGMRLAVPLYERILDEQVSLDGQEEYAGQKELDHLIERLRVRLGEGTVLQPEWVEAYIPEMACRFDEASWHGRPARVLGQKRNKRSRVGRPCHAARSHAPISPSPGTPGEGRGEGAILLMHSPNPHPRPLPEYRAREFNRPSHMERSMLPAARPLQLLPTPREVLVMVSPSEDAEGHPISFTHEGRTHRVTHYVGPERIAGQWWDGRDKTRDYFDVEDTEGRRFWVFRVRQTGRWYLHGGW